MKPETVQRKLNEILGIADKVEAIQTTKQQELARIIAVEEQEIPFFRAKQGLLYFLKAPELFTIRSCANCGEAYAVSRKHVAYCGYSCMAEGIRSWGMRWEKGNDLEALALDPQVYDGNEPLWVNNLPRLQELLTSLTSILDELSVSPKSTSLQVQVSRPVEKSTTSQDNPEPSELLAQMAASLSARTTTSSGSKPKKRSLNLKG